MGKKKRRRMMKRKKAAKGSITSSLERGGLK